MALSAINRDTDPGILSDIVNRLVTEFNRQDKSTPIYATAGGSGTAYTIAPIPGIGQYAVGQLFPFIAANANTSRTPTLNVNGRGAGTITRLNGTGLSPGDIPAGPAMVIVTATTPPAFALISPYASEVYQTFLLGNVALNNVANFFNGPTTGSIGGPGETWKITGAAAISDTVGVAAVEAALTGGGGTVNTSDAVGAANFVVNIPLAMKIALGGATAFTLTAKDQTSANGLLLTTGFATAAGNTATWIMAERLA